MPSAGSPKVTAVISSHSSMSLLRTDHQDTLLLIHLSSIAKCICVYLVFFTVLTQTHIQQNTPDRESMTLMLTDHKKMP